ncbi:MAG: 23S rRNA (adenine(2503)-C(2))-methyltransferase RlmN [Candidatus Peribacteraceae bacterium]|nr:23S rRNA (adenine(2503)-C(2))-methyltransferase RlmN [Candidatus Peribacteraceae bacterium]
MQPPVRRERFPALFPGEPAFRWTQAEQALFQEGKNGWADITTFSSSMRETLTKELPWMSVVSDRVVTNRAGDTHKAVLRTADGLRFETVLMKNKRGQWTICVSSQVGCAMRCTFCATGAMGLTRSLTSDEIVDQYRFWKTYLVEKVLPGRISNVVFMGMGEPMANYENVKAAIRTWLKHTDLGPVRITVSTVGVLWQLDKLLEDKDWPPVRIAISLHSANQKRREEIIPSTTPDFLTHLADWARRYGDRQGNRRHHVTYEYTLINGVNDSEEHAKELASYIRKTGAAKINVIPLNPVPGKPFTAAAQRRVDRFKDIVSSFGLDITQRRSMGEDIAAACGQLALETK